MTREPTPMEIRARDDVWRYGISKNITMPRDECLAIARAVIRGLKNPTPDVCNAIAVQRPLRTSITQQWNAGIDAASPPEAE